MKKIDKREVRAWQKFDKVHIELLEAGVELLSEKAISSLVFSALLSGSETAITSVPREKIHQLDDSKKNKRIKRAKDDIEKTIGGILVANNFVNILMASLATILFVRSFGESTGSILATLFITVLVLIFGEVTPKTIATRKPIEFISRTSILIDYLARIFAPFTNLITNSINRWGKSFPLKERL